MQMVGQRAELSCKTEGQKVSASGGIVSHSNKSKVIAARFIEALKSGIRNKSGFKKCKINVGDGECPKLG